MAANQAALPLARGALWECGLRVHSPPWGPRDQHGGSAAGPHSRREHESRPSGCSGRTHLSHPQPDTWNLGVHLDSKAGRRQSPGLRPPQGLLSHPRAPNPAHQVTEGHTGSSVPSCLCWGWTCGHQPVPDPRQGRTCCLCCSPPGGSGLCWTLKNVWDGQ